MKTEDTMPPLEGYLDTLFVEDYDLEGYYSREVEWEDDLDEFLLVGWTCEESFTES
jgi:hypothetical protein